MTDTIDVPSDAASAPAVTSRRREATRQKLLDAAAQVFAEEGLDAASVEAICERAGFTRGAFYSNFDSKDELFLELAGRVARARVESVRERVALLEREGGMHLVATDPLTIVEQVLDVSGDDRLAILLMSEIRIHALRDPQLGAAYLAQDAEMRASVAQIITDIGAGQDHPLPDAGRRGRAPHADRVGERIGARHDGGPGLRRRVPAHERRARPRRAARDRASPHCLSRRTSDRRRRSATGR